MVGRATLTIVRSTMVMKYATISKAKARQRRLSIWADPPLFERMGRAAPRAGGGGSSGHCSSVGAASVLSRSMSRLLQSLFGFDERSNTDRVPD